MYTLGFYPLSTGTLVNVSMNQALSLRLYRSSLYLTTAAQGRKHQSVPFTGRKQAQEGCLAF